MYLKRVEIKSYYFGRTPLVWECYASRIGVFAGVCRGTPILYLTNKSSKIISSAQQAPTYNVPPQSTS
jgi:hypothetical protein